MSFYQTTPFKPAPQLLVPGTPAYVFGSFNDKTGPTLGIVLSDSGNGTTSTVTFQILSGNIPITDTLISIVGTANAAGAYNATNAQILSVTQVNTPDDGVYTVTFLGSGNTAKAADYGQVYIAQREVGDQLTTTVASVPVMAGASGPASNGKSLSVTIKLPANTTANPSTLSGVTITVQGANFDLDSEYNDIGTVAAAVAAGTTTDWQSGQGDTATGTLIAGSVNLPNFRFYRLKVTGVTGAGPIIGKITM